MKLKLFISMVLMIQFSACGVFETQLNDSIQVNNQGIESRIENLENEIDKLKKELDQVTSIKHDLNPSIPKEKSELRAQYDNSENEKKEFESNNIFDDESLKISIKFDNSFNRDYGISFKKSSDYEVFQLDLNFYF